MDRWAAARSTKTVCVSQGVAEWCIQTERIGANKLLVIQNGIAIETEKHAIPSDSHTVPNDARILLFVGRLEHQKGVDVLISHAMTLLERLPNHHLVVIGEGSMRHELNTLSEGGNMGRIHCLGQRKDVRAWMARSELLLLPTRYEGMPNVILEAMAESLVVATTRVEGIAELLGERLQEQSVAKEDWDALFELAVTLVNAPQLRIDLGKANLLRAKSEFALDRQFMRYESLYTKS